MSEGYTAKTAELTNELDDFEELEELFELSENEEMLFDELKRVISLQAKNQLNIQLNNEDIDLKLFKARKKGHYLYVAVFADQTRVPHTTLGFAEETKGGGYDVSDSYIGDFLVNMAKTSLLMVSDEVAIVSQRPFSTYEEYYVISKSKPLKLIKTFWSDRSLSYYQEIEKFVISGDLAGAMSMEDTTEYPMTYEKEMFHSGNAVYQEVLSLPDRTHLTSKEALQQCEWGLNYYFMMHYALSIDELIDVKFEPILIEKAEDYGAKYSLDKALIKEGILIYSNYLAKNNYEKKANIIKALVEKNF